MVTMHIYTYEINFLNILKKTTTLFCSAGNKLP